MLFDYLEAASDEKLIQQLDRNEYREEELIEIKIPFQVPYNTDWADYRREDGEIEVQGQYYSYVKIKISQDTIYLKCLPNAGKNKLAAARQEISKKLNNLPGNDEESGSIIKKANLIFCFSEPITVYQIHSPQHTLKRHYPRYQSCSLPGYEREKLQPPIV